MAKKSSIDAKSLKGTAASSSSSTASLQKATKEKLSEAGSSTVVLDSQKVRDVVVASSTGTSAAEVKAVATTMQAASMLKEDAVSGPRVTPKSRNTETLVTEKIPSSVAPVSQSTLNKTNSILDDAIRESEEEERQEQLEEQKELESENLVHELRASATRGEQREDGTVDPEEVDLDAMRDAAAATVAENVLKEAEEPESDPEEEQEAPKGKFQQLVEWVTSDTKHMLIAAAVVAGVAILIVKLIKK